jgi:Xaa-Pro aminopeptidase
VAILSQCRVAGAAAKASAALDPGLVFRREVEHLCGVTTDRGQAMTEPSACRGIYQGDAVLDRMLAVACSAYDAAGAAALLRGVEAAALPRGETSWQRLVAADPSPALAAQLDALKARVAAPTAAASSDRGRHLDAVRAKFVDLGVDGFIVPRADEYQNEYVPACNERLAWLTGFTGSAGLAIVLADRAALFTDGRYTLQAAAQVDASAYTLRHVTEAPPEAWLGEVLKPGQRLGYDAWLLTPDQVARFQRAVDAAGASLVAVAWNPVDAAWSDRPAVPLGPVMAFDFVHAGRTAEDKRREAAAALLRGGCRAGVLTAPDSIAWLLNIRGCDVPHTPLPLSFAILYDDAEVDLFVDRRKLLPEVPAHLGAAVAIRAPEEFGPRLDRLGDTRVLVDPASAAAWVVQRLAAAGATVDLAADPVRLPKACKNPVELAGIRAAHRRDGAAMVRFLAWLAATLATRPVREIEASDRLEQFRAQGQGFRGLSFDTISGAGPNGAVIHYRATPETERVLEPGSFYLVDSGAQYLDGTTDITRTLALGEPSAEMKDRYTRVLKGHIALAMAVFPAGTSGAALDVLARSALWQAGISYDHGTGHGVGHYLSVHEGPQRIHYQNRDGQALLPGMVVSNEPGYYKPGAFGIRIENLVAVTPVTPEGGERPVLGFETLTLCPIDTAPIERALLTAPEIAWFDAYHARVRAEIAPLLEGDAAALAWLERATAPL